MEKEFKIEVCRRYYVTKTYTVKARTEDEARERAENMSGDEDNTGNLQLEDVEVTTIEN